MRERMDDLYRDYILEHYRRPHNFGQLDGATASQEGANPLCGDRITMQLRVRGGVIDGVAFTGRGCAISQASASLLTDEIKGKDVEKANAMSSGDVLELLGIEISPARMKCALLSLETMHGALGADANAGAAPDPGDTAPAEAQA
jgi:nitrogen fixation NifU-like protein